MLNSINEKKTLKDILTYNSIISRTGYIYKMSIKDGSLTDCFIGSTYRLRERKMKHKRRCNNPNESGHDSYVYQFIRDHGGFDNWDLYELEEFKYDNKKELCKKEREWVEQLKPTLNKHVRGRTHEEYRSDNKERIKAYNHEWGENNKEHKKEYDREWREKNKERYKELCKEYNKRYKEKHHDELLSKSKETHFCDCGGRYTRTSKTKHLSTITHQEYLKSLCEKKE